MPIHSNQINPDATMTTDGAIESQEITRRFAIENQKQEIVRFRRIGDRIEALIKIFTPIIVTALAAFLFNVRDEQKTQSIYFAQLKELAESNAKEISSIKLQFATLKSDEVITNRILEDLQKQIDKIERKFELLINKR